MLKRDKKNKEAGFMVEVMVALSIATLSLLGILSILTRSLNLNKVYFDKLVAANLAAEGIEVVKNIIDKNVALKLKQDSGSFNDDLNDGYYVLDFSCFRLGSGSFNCSNIGGVNESVDIVFGRVYFLRLDDLNRYVYTNDANLKQTNFKRVVRIENLIDTSNGGRFIKIKSYVQWLSRDFSNILLVEDHFYDWR